MKKDRLRRPRRVRRGFNLIELLVVITIIGMITGIIGVNIYAALERARVETAQTQIGNLVNALGMYRVRFSRYPETSAGLEALLRPPGEREGFIEEVPIDPWGKPYVYTRPDPRGQKKFLVASAGPDGLMDTADDVRN